MKPFSARVSPCLAKWYLNTIFCPILYIKLADPDNKKQNSDQFNCGMYQLRCTKPVLTLLWPTKTQLRLHRCILITAFADIKKNLCASKNLNTSYMYCSDTQNSPNLWEIFKTRFFMTCLSCKTTACLTY